MRLLLLIAITMVAFASNSLLTRIGVFDFEMDPMAFAVVRVASGAIVLSALVWSARKAVPLRPTRRWWGGAALAVYMVGFSWAYLQLDAGLGALILFGVMQVAMFMFAVLRGDAIPGLRWLGAGVAFLGLVLLLWPSGAASVHTPSALAMTAAGLGWAAYTLLGQGERDAVAASAGNFVLCLPAVGIVWTFAGGGATVGGVIAAMIAGGVTSGLGYALWYRIVPNLPTTIAAVAQLSVPVIAVVAGALLLGEVLTARLLLAGALVLGGIGLSIWRRSG